MKLEQRETERDVNESYDKSSYTKLNIKLKKVMRQKIHQSVWSQWSRTDLEWSEQEESCNRCG